MTTPTARETVLGRIRDDLRTQFKVQDARHELLMKLQACSRKALPKAIEKHLGGQEAA